MWKVRAEGGASACGMIYRAGAEGVPAYEDAIAQYNEGVERWWARLKKQRVYQRTFATRQEAKDPDFAWIVVWYH